MYRFIFLIVLILLIVFGWSAAWFYGSTRVQVELDNFLQASQNGSEQLSCGEVSVAGFPFRYDITCTDFQIQSADLTINTPQILATILVYRPTHALIFATGPARFNDAFSGSSRELRWENLRASVRTNGWALARISIEADRLELFDTLVGEKLVASAARAEAHLLDNPDNYNAETQLVQLGAFARLDGVQVPEFDVSKGEAILEASIEALPDDLRLFSPAIIAHNWFEAETGIDIIKFNGQDAQSLFALNGRISTTEQARLTGDFGLHTENIADRLSALFEPAVLQIIFGFPDETGSYNQSFSVRHGVVMAGNLPVMTLPALQ